MAVVLAADWAVAATAKMPAVMMEVKRIVKVVGGLLDMIRRLVYGRAGVNIRQRVYED